MGQLAKDLINGNFMRSAVEGDLAGVREAVRAGARLNKTDNKGRTALMLAAQAGDAAMFSYLARKGAATAFLDNEGNDALMLAIMARQEKTAVLCLSHSFNTEANAAGKTALSLAAACDMPKLIAPLIAGGCDLAHQDATGATPLMLAEEAGLTESFRVLLARDDIDLEAQDADGRTVLMRAITRGHRETIEALLLAGASASHNDRRSLSVMDFARRWGMEDMLRDAFEKYDVSLLRDGSRRPVGVMKKIQLRPGNSPRGG